MNAKRWFIAMAVMLGLAGFSRGAQVFSGDILAPDYQGTARPFETLTFTLTCAVGTNVLWTENFKTDANGSFAVTRSTMTPPGTYSFFVKGPHFLQRANSVIPVSSSGAGAMFFFLRNGDVDGDNIVSVFDYIILSDAFDSTTGDAAFVENADLDGDGTVSVFDYIILSDNFDRQGEDPA